MILSILICSLESRKHLLERLLEHLEKQKTTDVEVLYISDNKEISTGQKRNNLLHMASGKYVIFIDDDDWVPPYYIEKLLEACSMDVDCVAINGIITSNGDNEIEWRLSKDNNNVTIRENNREIYLRKTNHITAIKREHALKAMFPNISNAEDKAYSDRVNQYLKTEYKIELPMYHYRFITYNKEY